MMKMRLKKGEDSCRVVDGAFAGREYLRGVDYPKNKIPENLLEKFSEVRTPGNKGAKKQ